jgi:hypothetical protein
MSTACIWTTFSMYLIKYEEKDYALAVLIIDSYLY